MNQGMTGGKKRGHQQCFWRTYICWYLSIKMCTQFTRAYDSINDASLPDDRWLVFSVHLTVRVATSNGFPGNLLCPRLQLKIDTQHRNFWNKILYIFPDHHFGNLPVCFWNCTFRCHTHPRVHRRWHHIAAHGLGNITHCDGGTDGTGEGETTFRAPWLEPTSYK